MIVNELELLHSANQVFEWMNRELSALGSSQRSGESDIYLAGGDRLVQLGELGAAVEHYQKALEICDSLGRERCAIECQIRLADCYILRSDIHTGLHLANQALEQARALNFPKGIALAQLAAGNSLWRLEKITEARAALNEARGLFVSLDDLYNVSQTDLALGTIAAMLDDNDTAEATYLSAYDYFNQQNFDELACRTLNNLAGVMYQRRDLAKTREYMEKCLTYKLPRNSMLMLNVVCNLGLLDVQELKLDSARKNLNRALLLARESREIDVEAYVLVNLAVTSLLSFELTEALNYSNLAVLRAQGRTAAHHQAVIARAVARLANGHLDSAEDLPSPPEEIHADVLWQMIFTLQSLMDNGVFDQHANAPDIKAQAERWLKSMRAVLPESEYPAV